MNSSILVRRIIWGYLTLGMIVMTGCNSQVLETQNPVFTILSPSKVVQILTIIPTLTPTRYVTPTITPFFIPTWNQTIHLTPTLTIEPFVPNMKKECLTVLPEPPASFNSDGILIMSPHDARDAILLNMATHQQVSNPNKIDGTYGIIVSPSLKQVAFRDGLSNKLKIES